MSANFTEYTTPHYGEGDMLYTASLSTIRLTDTTTMRLADTTRLAHTTMRLADNNNNVAGRHNNEAGRHNNEAARHNNKAGRHNTTLLGCDTIHAALAHPSPTQFSTNNFISILYFNIYIFFETLYLQLNIVHL